MNLHLVLIRLARRGLLAFCTLFALLALFGTQALPASAAAPPSFIRLVNASPDVGTVDVFVDGAKFLGNVRFASVTSYLQLPPGPHKVELALIGKGVGAPVLVQKLSVQTGTAYTVAAIGTKSAGLSLQVFTDDNRMVNGMATVRVYDLSPQSGALSVASGTNTLVGPLSYRQVSNYQKLAAGLYTFTFSSSQPAFTLVDQVTLKTDTVTSLFLIGVPYGTPPLQVVNMQVKGLPRLLAGTGSDPNALPLSASKSAPLPALPLGVLALVGIAVGLFTRFWPFSRQKGSSRLRPRGLFGAALGALLALCLSLGGLSFAFFMTHRAPAPSARLLIPAIGVNATIESVGVRPNGAMDTPRQIPWSDVGLYTGGPYPGDRGSAVIAGHLDRPGGNPAVFWLLRELHVNDEVQIVNAQGKVLRFHVTRIEAYPVQDPPVQDIFGNTSGRFLNLTTCAGDWIPTQHSRTMRLVIYTSFGPPPAATSAVTSSTPLTWPWSSSNTAPPTTVPSSPSSSTSSTAVNSSSSSSGFTIPTPLPAAIRSTVTIRLPGVSPAVVQRMVKQGKQSSVLSSSTPAYRSSIARLAPSLLSQLLHQVSEQLTHIPIVGKLLHQVNRPPTHTPVVGTVLHQTSRLPKHTPVVGTVLHQASKQLTRTPLPGNLLYRVNRPLTGTPAVGTVLHQASKPLTHTPVVGKPLTHIPVVGKPLQQVSKPLTHTPVVGKPLQQVSKPLTHTPVPGKPLTHTPVVGKPLHQATSQLTHTGVVGKPLQQASKPLTHTPVVGKPLQQTSRPLTHAPVAGKSLQQASRPLTHTPVVGKPLQQVSKPLTHTPVPGKSLQQASRPLTHTPVIGRLPHKAHK